MNSVLIMMVTIVLQHQVVYEPRPSTGYKGFSIQLTNDWAPQKSFLRQGIRVTTSNVFDGPKKSTLTIGRLSPVPDDLRRLSKDMETKVAAKTPERIMKFKLDNGAIGSLLLIKSKTPTLVTGIFLDRYNYYSVTFNSAGVLTVDELLDAIKMVKTLKAR